MARLPREREEPKPKAEKKPPAPARQVRGMSRGMVVVLALTVFVGALSIFVGKCAANRGKPTKARTHWNAPVSVSTRKASLDDLRGQAEARARIAVPDAKLARVTGRQVDATGQVDLDYGAAGFEFVAPPGATLCGVEEGIAWQGWTQRTRTACSDVPLEMKCTFEAAVKRAFPTPPAAVQFVVETVESGATWTFWSLDVEGPPVVVPDDC